MKGKKKPKERKRKTRRRRGDGCVYKHTKGAIWYLKYKVGRKTKVESSRTDDYGEAVKLLRKKLSAIDSGAQPIGDKLSFEDASKDLKADYVVNGRTSLSMVSRYIKKHLSPFFGSRRMASISPADISAYVDGRKGQTFVAVKAHTITHADGREEKIPAVRKAPSNGEINRELTTLKRMFNLAIENGKLAQRPYIKMLTEAPPRAGFLSPEEFAAIKRRLPEPEQGVATFGYLTGWRIASEVAPLAWAQVDLSADGCVRIEPGASKTREPRTFPLTRDLRALLQSRRKATDETQRRLGKVISTVFHDDDGEPVYRFDISWKAAATAAGHPWTIPHDLRRCGVRNLVRAGIPERVAMQMTGHKTRSVFERYNIVSEGDYRDAARRLDGAERHVS